MSCLASFSFPPNLYSTQEPECPDQNMALILSPSCCPEDEVQFPQHALHWLPLLAFKQQPKHLSLTSLASQFPD